jgi:hypothetical protein
MDALILIPISETEPDAFGTFDEEKTVRDLREISGVSQLKKGNFIDAIWQCHFSFNDDKTIVRLSDDLKDITISGLGDASLQMALELQRRESRPLRVVNYGYDFDLILKDIKTLEEFKEKIKAAELQAA